MFQLILDSMLYNRYIRSILSLHQFEILFPTRVDFRQFFSGLRNSIPGIIEMSPLGKDIIKDCIITIIVLPETNMIYKCE